jgi:hypothetical protein
MSTPTPEKRGGSGTGADEDTEHETPQNRKERLLFYVFLAALLVTVLTGNFKSFQRQTTLHAVTPECVMNEREMRVICHMKKRVVSVYETEQTALDRVLARFLPGKMAASRRTATLAIAPSPSSSSSLHPAIARLQAPLQAALRSGKNSFSALADGARAAAARTAHAAGAAATALRRRVTRQRLLASATPAATTAFAPAGKRPGSALLEVLRGRRSVPRLGVGAAW